MQWKSFLIVYYTKSTSIIMQQAIIYKRAQVSVSLLVEDEVPKWQERWPEVVNMVGAPIISIQQLSPLIFPLVYTDDFHLLSRNVMRSVILGVINSLSLFNFDNAFMYLNWSLVGDTVSTERRISCWSLSIILWKYSSCYILTNDRVDRSDWTSHIHPYKIRGALMKKYEQNCPSWYFTSMIL